MQTAAEIRAKAKWEKNHPEWRKAYSQRYRRKHRQQILVKNKLRYQRIRVEHIAKTIAEREFLRDEFLKHYGLVCRCCDEANKLFLTIDHLNNNGAVEKRERGHRNTHGILRHLKKSGWPEGYATMCFNCNCGRARNKGVCPHVS